MMKKCPECKKNTLQMAFESCIMRRREEMNVRITYHGHSGFSVQTEKHLLVFDYLGEGLDEPRQEDHAIVFVSHAHGDHFHPSVVRWAEEGRALLVTGDDVVSPGFPMKPGERLDVGGVAVRAFDSTDQGVSFLVQADGWSIFHAGDLNFWHWRHESTQEEIREAEEWFERAIAPLQGRKIDAAFFPADPRMGEGYEEGALRFMEAVRPDRLIPMHFWDRPEAAQAMKRHEPESGTQIFVLTRPGETLDIV